MPLDNLGSEKIKKMKVGYISKPNEVETFMKNCEKVIKSKKLRTMFSRNCKEYLKTRKTSIIKMTSIIEKLENKKLYK